MAIKKGQSGRVEDFIAVHTTGESVAENDAVALTSDYWLDNDLVTQLTDDTDKSINTTTWRAQGFTTSANARRIRNFRVYVGHRHAGFADGLFRVKIRSTLNGADVWTGDAWMFTGNGTNAYLTFNDINLAVSPNTTYYVMVMAAGTGGTTLVVRVKNGATPSGTLHVSTDSGANWSSDGTGYAFHLEIDEQGGYADELVKASAAAFGARLNFVGFAMETKSAGQACKVNRNAIATLSGLTPGSTYYLANSQGALSTTPGTVERRVGKALSSSL